MKRSVTASAPGKLMLFGEHAVVYGHPCIVTAVDQRVRVTVDVNGIGELHVTAPQVGLEEYCKKIGVLGEQDVPKQVHFIEQVVANFYKRFDLNEGIRVTTESDFLASFGFGSSAAVTVALGKVLSEYFGKHLSDQELFEMSLAAVRDVQGVGSGFDVAAAVYGGTLYYVTPGKKIEKVSNGHLPLVVGYTGVKADTPTLVRQVAELRRVKNGFVDEVFDEIAEVVEEARSGFENHNFLKLGKLMRRNQKLLGELRVSSIELDRLIKACESVGAHGAKLSGAGGGDCMISIHPSDDKHQVVRAVEGAGGEVVSVGFGAEGVRLE